MPYQFVLKVISTVFVITILASAQSWAQEKSQVITQKRAEFLTYYRTSDVDKIVEQYHDEATFAGTLGPFWLIGKEAIRGLWTNYFNAWPERDLSFRGQKGIGSEPELAFYAKDTVSVETGYMLMYMGEAGKTPVVTNIRYSITRVKTGEDWLIINMNVSRIPGQ